MVSALQPLVKQLLPLVTKLANSSLKDITSNEATTINMQSHNKNKHQHIILSNDINASMQSNTHPSKNKTSIIGLLDNQRTNITLQKNNQSDERSQKDNLVQSSKDNNTPSKYSRSNKDEEEDMDEEEREGKEGDDKKVETIDHEETIDYETPGTNNVAPGENKTGSFLL